MTKSKSFLSAPVAILIGAVLIAGSILYIGSGSPSDGTAVIVPEEEDGQPDRIEDYGSLVTENDPVLGDPNAPVTIVEFSDLQCMFCRGFWLSTYPQLKENYIDTGIAKLVFRDFPLPFHEAAEFSAVGGQCAHDQEKFWEYHDEVYDQQMQLEDDPLQAATTISYDEDDLKEWARQAGLDGEEFDACLDAYTHVSRVQDDLADGQKAGVDGTPSFFVNGIRIIGAQPYTIFSQIIDTEL